MTAESVEGLPAIPERVLERLPDDLHPVFRESWGQGVGVIAELIRWFGQLDWTRMRSTKVSDAPGWPAVKDGEPVDRVNAAVVCLAWAAPGWRADYGAFGGIDVWFNLKKLAGAIRFKKGQVSAQQARLLCRLAGTDRGEGVAIGASKAYLDGGGPLSEIKSDLEDLLARLKAGDADRQATSVPGLMGAEYAESADLARRRVQIEELLGTTAADGTVSDAGELVDGTDPTAAWARDALSAHPGAVDLVRHLRRSVSGTQPSAKWTDTTRTLLESSVDASQFLGALIDRAGDAQIRAVAIPATTLALYDRSTQDLLRAAAWAAAVQPLPAVEERLLKLARRCGERLPEIGPPAPKICTAAVHSLATIGSAASVASLGELERRLKNPSLLAQVDKAMSGAAGRVASSRARLQEASIPGLDLGPDGTRTVELGARRSAVVAVIGAKQVTTTWMDDDGSTRTMPSAWKVEHPEQVKAVKAVVSKVRAALATERQRQEGLLLEDDRWTIDDWRRVYLDHPLASSVADGVIWIVEDEDGRRTAIARDRALVTLTGDAVDLARGTVRLWHPIEAPSPEIESWRSYLVDGGIRQPFKQAFREVYALTPAEIESVDHSRRFAGQLLDARRLYMLVKERQWAMPRLGGWDGGYDAPASRRVQGTDLTAQFWAAASLEDGRSLATTCITGDLRFVRGSGSKVSAVHLADVPPRALSETMRDIDLFISICSLAMSPDWMLEHQANPHGAALLGRHSTLATSRLAALERILPALAIADRCELRDGFLHIEGHLHSYRIHLGSGHVFREPGSRYLCIVPKSIGAARNVFLPFDDDTTLAVIISKAMLLADDHKIRDESILLQLQA